MHTQMQVERVRSIKKKKSKMLKSVFIHLHIFFRQFHHIFSEKKNEGTYKKNVRKKAKQKQIYLK